MRYLLAVAVDGKAEEKKKKHDNKMIHLGLTRMIALGLTNIPPSSGQTMSAFFK